MPQNPCYIRILGAKKTLHLNRNGSDYKVFSLGSPCWARTSDIMINSHALYRLS